MKSALPYLGIVVFLAIVSIAISLFLQEEGSAVNSDGSTEYPLNMSRSDFPQVGEAQRVIGDLDSSPSPYRKEIQKATDEIENPEDLLEGVLAVVGKDSEQNSYMFNWKHSQTGTNTGEKLVIGHQIKFQGANDDANVAKEYLRGQGFLSNIENTKSAEGMNVEGFSRDQLVCVVASVFPSQNFFQEEKAINKTEDEIRVYCGKME